MVYDDLGRGGGGYLLQRKGMEGRVCEGMGGLTTLKCGLALTWGSFLKPEYSRSEYSRSGKRERRGWGKVLEVTSPINECH